MASFSVGSYGPAKRHATRGIEATDFIVLKTVAGPASALLFSAEAYVSRVDAEAVAAHLAPGAVTAATQAAHDDAVTRRKAEYLNLGIRLFTNIVSSLDNFNGVAPLPVGAAPPPPQHALVGSTIKYTVNVLDVSGLVVVDRTEVDVTITAPHASIADAFDGTYVDAAGINHGIILSKTVVEAAALAALPPPPPPLRDVIAIDVAVAGSTFFDLVKLLPFSKLAAPGHLDSLELVAALTSAGMPLLVADPADANFSIGVYVVLGEIKPVMASLPPRVYPSTHADRLGIELKKEIDKYKAGAPVPIIGGATAAPAASGSRFPLSDELKKLALDDPTWKGFLARSILTTVDNDRHERAATDDYVKMGLLESYLKKADATVTSISAHAPVGSLVEAELVSAIMVTFVPVASGSTGSVVSDMGTKNVSVSVHNQDLTGSSEERRHRLALREAYDDLAGDAAATKQLDELYAIKDSPVDLSAHVRAMPDTDGLKRLVSTDSDVERALSGAFARPQPPPNEHAHRHARVQPVPALHLLRARREPLCSPRPPSYHAVGDRLPGHSLRAHAPLAVLSFRARSESPSSARYPAPTCPIYFGRGCLPFPSYPAWPGCDVVTVRKIASVRNVLDRRVELLVYGDKSVLSETKRQALRCVRTGRFDSLRLFHLIGKDDCGSISDPLKELKKKSFIEQKNLVIEAFQRLMHVISVASPMLSPRATDFLFKLQKVVVDSITDGAPIDSLSTWLASVLALVARPRKQYAFNEGGSSDACFSCDYVTQLSDERTALERATQDARAVKAAHAARSGAANDVAPIGKVRKIGDREPDPNSKRSLAKAKLARQEPGPKAAEVAKNEGGVRRGKGVGSKGTSKPPPTGDKDLDAAGKKVAWYEFNKTHPPKGDQRACWFMWQPSGCNKPDCSHHHDEP